MLALAGARTASAQYTPTELAEGRFRISSLRLTPTLALVDAGRDSNVYRTTIAVADSAAVTRATLTVGLPIRSRLRLSGAGWLDYAYYRHQGSQRSLDPGGDARAELDLGPFTFVGGGGLLDARQLYSIDIDERVLRKERYGYGGLDCRLSGRLSLSAGAESRSYRFDEDRFVDGQPTTVATALDRSSLAARLQARYRITALTSLVGLADLIEDDFRFALAGEGPTRSRRYLAGFEFGERALVVGRATFGLRDVPRSSSGSLPAYRGPAAQIEIRLPLRDGRLALAAERDLQVSANVTLGPVPRREAYVLTALRGTFEWELPLALLSRLDGRLEEAHYLTGATGSNGVSRTDRRWVCGASLLRMVGDTLRLGGTVGFERRTSPIAGHAYDRWVYGVQAELKP